MSIVMVVKAEQSVTLKIVYCWKKTVTEACSLLKEAYAEEVLPQLLALWLFKEFKEVWELLEKLVGQGTFSTAVNNVSTA
jgi:hypothetical protein